MHYDNQQSGSIDYFLIEHIVSSYLLLSGVYCLIPLALLLNWRVIPDIPVWNLEIFSVERWRLSQTLVGNYWNSKLDQKDQVLHCCGWSVSGQRFFAFVLAFVWGCLFAKPPNSTEFDLCCPLHLCSAMCIRAIKVRGANLQDSWFILRAPHHVSFCCSISLLFIVNSFAVLEDRAHGRW